MGRRGGQVKLTGNQRKLVVSDFISGTSAGDIAVALGVPRHAIYRELVRNNLRPGDNQRYGTVLKKVDAALAEKMYKAGASMKELRTFFGVGHGTLRNALKSRNVELRLNGRYADIKDEDIAAAYRSGESQTAIANRLGISQARVSKILKMMGVDIRAKGRARGESHGAWKGGRQSTADGYILVWVDTDDPMFCMTGRHGYALEHRLVMAREIGRPLSKHETVHHIDGDTTNNCIENLQSRFGKHGRGVKLCCQDCGSFKVKPTEI